MELRLVEPWLQFSTPIVRQLAFAVASPNIMRQIPQDLVLTHHFSLHDDDVWQQHYLDYLPKLKRLDQNPNPLLDFVAQLKSTRLGLRFEMLVWFWLLDDAYHPYQLLGHSIQMIEGAKTLGELDFVIFNRDLKRIEHWEVAVKYYLAEADGTLEHWYGLNRTDRLARKLQHFTQKQFQFSHALNHDIETRFCMLKGQLYLPTWAQHLRPNWVNPARRLGTWGHHIPTQNPAYYRLQRHEWLCVHTTQSSQPAVWWTDGLYKQQDQEDYYMYRQAPHLSRKIE